MTTAVLRPICPDAEGGPLGYSFFCPGCRYAHQVYLRRIPGGWQSDIWDWNGSVDKPTFTPSVLVRSVAYPKGGSPEDRAEWDRLHAGPTEGFLSSRFGTRCHSFVADGVIDFLNDCTHALRGKHPLPPYPQPRVVDGDAQD